MSPEIIYLNDKQNWPQCETCEQKTNEIASYPWADVCNYCGQEIDTTNI